MLLLGIDGVVIRDERLLGHVKDNWIRYVRQKLPESRPAETTRILQLVHGHPALGLERAFQIDTSDFIDKVYDDSLISHLYDVLDHKEFGRDVRDLERPVTLFTNAPERWARPVASSLGPDVSWVCPGHYKPDQKSYSQFSDKINYIFIDDSIKNLTATRNLPNWKPVFYNQNSEKVGWCPSICSLYDVNRIYPL